MDETLYQIRAFCFEINKEKLEEKGKMANVIRMAHHADNKQYQDFSDRLQVPEDFDENEESTTVTAPVDGAFF